MLFNVYFGLRQWHDIRGLRSRAHFIGLHRDGDAAEQLAACAHCVIVSGLPGRKPRVLAVKHPVRPYKNAIQNQFAMENAMGA
jgi:hypothetical protein